MSEAKFDPLKLPDYRWIENGQSNLSGVVLDLFKELDRFFLQLAGECRAVEYYFPTFIQASELAKLDYFRSFPHLVTFPVALDPNEENIRNFMSGEPYSNNEIKFTKIAPVCDCLTPAACYHFYIHHQGETLTQPKYMTTRNNCFRRETHYVPMRRQWNFNMREIVCLGTADEVMGFINRYRDRLTQLFARMGLPLKWEIATDPFFDPTKNPKFIMQQLEPVKTEMIYEDGLSVGSINYHRNYFGDAFKIQRQGAEAFSGCVAFGMERWIYMILNEFGTKPENWPRFQSE